MSIQDGGPAFPVADYDHQIFQPATTTETMRDLSGMSLRDYFAAKALQAVIPHGCYDYEEGETPTAHTRAAFAARDAYRFADAMLAARSA